MRIGIGVDEPVVINGVLLRLGLLWLTVQQQRNHI
jgi:hypothetical protein